MCTFPREKSPAKLWMSTVTTSENIRRLLWDFLAEFTYIADCHIGEYRGYNFFVVYRGKKLLNLQLPMLFSWFSWVWLFCDNKCFNKMKWRRGKVCCSQCRDNGLLQRRKSSLAAIFRLEFNHWEWAGWELNVEGGLSESHEKILESTHLGRGEMERSIVRKLGVWKTGFGKPRSGM